MSPGGYEAGCLKWKKRAQSAWSELKNYKSFHDIEDSVTETERLIQKGLVKKILKDEVEQYFDEPQGFISKVKESGQNKRLVIVDALWSGVNQKATCPARIVLPQAEDVHHTLKDMKAREAKLLRRYRAYGWDTGEGGRILCRGPDRRLHALPGSQGGAVQLCQPGK